MNRITLASLLAGASLLAAGSLQAQDNVTLTATHAPGGGNVTAFGYYMSPYTGTVDGVTGVRINCVDFFHEVTQGESWSAGEYNLGTAASAGGSTLGLTRNGLVYGANATTLDIYEQAAWLTNQFALDPASNANQSTAIQTAIWYLSSEYDPTHPTNTAAEFSAVKDYWSNGGATTSINVASTNTDVNSTGYWVYQAEQAYNHQVAGYYNQFAILTAGAPDGKNAQEYIYKTTVTPEPGTFVMIGTGLFMVLGLTFRSRRRDGADAGFGSAGMLA